jgi:poly-gamma-glutamate capsule biosynthesis protein CapA/YwtB (metallophosphatase superfamily)
VIRRHFLQLVAGMGLGAASRYSQARASPPRRSSVLFLCGDVMTARGVDQVLPHPSDPQLHEGFVTDAREYVRMAERKNGKIPAPVEPSYPWGDALEELERAGADARIVNLETAVTANGQPAPKGIHYRMHPANVACLEALGIDCCVLSNNHALDWGPAGLDETLRTLRRAGIATAGAGRDAAEARAPAVLTTRAGARVLVFGFADGSAGIPASWAAAEHRAGLQVLADLSDRSAAAVIGGISRFARPRDLVVASIHWGPNWGYAIPDAQRRFARALLDSGFVHVIHGHSSHHPKGIEVHGGRPILYGCGDFINDYEGIRGQAEYRPDLSLMYLVEMDRETGRLVSLMMTPLQIMRFRLWRAKSADVVWLRTTLDREGRALGTGVVEGPRGTLELRWG